MRSLTIIALAATGQGISGGDRIFIEFAKRWQKKIFVKILVTEEGLEMCRRQELLKSKNLNFKLFNLKQWNRFGFGFFYLIRIITSIKWAFTLSSKQHDTVYSASEFWMDSFPAVILKLRNPKTKWIAAWYQTAPNPLIGYSYSKNEKRYQLKALVYWLMQLPVKWLIKWKADYVLVNNENEKNVFPKLKRQGKVIVVLGAVDLESISRFKIQDSRYKKYDAVFQGRFHPQKGVEELVDIWKIVVKRKPNAKLVMIGDGPLRKNIELRIKNKGLKENIILKGYVFDGREKYQIFSQSKIVVHPSLFDSGGMASAEAMVFGLPVIGFDLKSYETYYPVGMDKVRIGDLKAFANTCIKYIDNSKLRKKIGNQAKDFIIKNRSWDKISRQIFDLIYGL